MLFKKVAIIFAILGSVAGCSQSDTPQDGGERKTSGIDFSHQFVSIVLPPGVNLDMPYDVVEDRIYTKENGEMRRAIVLDIAEGSAQQSFEKASGAFSAAGFKKKGKVNSNNNGKISVTFRKKGRPDYFVLASDGMKSKPDGAAVTSNLWISWPIRPASEDSSSTKAPDSSQ